MNNLLLFFLFCDDRHLWLKRHLKYWQASRCPPTQPPYPWMPWLLLLLSPSFGILLIVEAFNQLSRLFATLATISIIIFFNVCSFSKHRMQHISGLQSPALLGYFFGLIIQSLLWYFIYLTPHILWNSHFLSCKSTWLLPILSKDVRLRLTGCSQTPYLLVCYTAVFSVVTQRSSPVLRDNTKNFCAVDYFPLCASWHIRPSGFCNTCEPRRSIHP